VKGVGPVVLGYTKTKVYAHDKLYALPSLKQVEVKSIEVLDEEQDSVGPGVRIGWASPLRGLRWRSSRSPTR